MQAIPAVRVVEWKCNDSVLRVQFRGIELVRNEIDAKWRSPVPGAFLADAVFSDRHVVLVHELHTSGIICIPVQRRSIRFGHQCNACGRGDFQQVGRQIVAGMRGLQQQR